MSKPDPRAVDPMAFSLLDRIGGVLLT